jgi:Transcriptional regulator, AbiEi antitoxin, Type IV TA system/Transcriptional regulator, AbiEi antitoxin N-terminal domain
LQRDLPEGLVVDAAWLRQRGFSRQLLSHYVGSGWLAQPTRGVYWRPRGEPRWQLVVISLQTLLRRPLLVGGRTALELHGYAHYLPRDMKEVHLYGPKPPPGWLHKLPLEARFVYRNSEKLFRNDPITRALTSVSMSLETHAPHSSDAIHGSWMVQPWGQWDWPLILSTPERAVLELLDELPQRESFHQADMLMEGLANLSPRRLQKLLADCRSVKVKRLFFFFADRHQHAWLKRLDRNAIDLGEGKRMLVKNGSLNKAYQITVPQDLDAVQ